MNKLKRIFLAILVSVFLPLVSIAQPGGTAGNGPGPTDFGSTGDTSTQPDDNAYPIDSHLWILLLIGCVYIFFKYQTVYKSQYKR